ncbi:MAG: gamma-glutamyltransferase [Synergistaceae bacterium]|jgi:gamma-glutamyltranspeptidase/glutathione hydrolase|nr:gamma-glutamyltransferase [Synergistaceae bacterium]
MQRLSGFLAILGLVSLLFCGAEAQAANAPIAYKDVTAKNGMVAAANELASRAGVEILQKGGNAIDAAVATALALNVVEPNASGIGGGGFATIRLADGSIVCWDFREMAPGASTKDMYASEQSKKEKWTEVGGKSVGVPGSVAGLFTILGKYGTLSFAEVAAPAIKLAEEGFTVDKLLASMIEDNFEKISNYNPDGTPYTPDGLPLKAGDTLKNPVLAKTFKLLAEKGPDVYYKGEIGDAVVAAVKKAGGIMTKADLNAYKIQQREPVVGTYRGFTVVGPPPASSAGVHVMEILNIMETFPVAQWGHNGEKYLHTLAETSKMMFADRSKYMADTAFAKVPIHGLASKGYAVQQAGRIKSTAMTTVDAGDPWPFDDKPKTSWVPAGEHNSHQSTTHFSVMDNKGNVVGWTWTINYFFGSGVFVPEYGFMLNDEMDDFATNPASVNAPEPGKRPLSSMTPTIVLDKKGQPFMTLGSPGATRIILAVAQIIMNAVDFGMSMDEAIEAPRLFNSVSGGKAGKLMIEAGVAETTVNTLRLRGHDVDPRPKDLYFGGAQGIMYKNGTFIGGADSRRNGVAVGY